MIVQNTAHNNSNDDIRSVIKTKGLYLWDLTKEVHILCAFFPLF